MSDQEKKRYRLLTGIDNDAFCTRVSGALADGYVLYGSPSCTYDPDTKTMRVAQAIIWPEP